MFRRILAGCLALGAGAVVVKPVTAQSCGEASLILDARASLLLPANFGIQGVVPGPAGNLTLWAADGTVLSVDRDRQLRQRKLPDTVRAAGMGYGTGGLRVLDTDGREYLFSEDGSLRRLGQVMVGPQELLDQALWQDDGWVIGLRRTDSRRFMVRRENAAGVAALFQSGMADSVPAIPRYQLSDGGATVVLTHLTAPFELIRVSAAGADTLPLPLGESAGAWIPQDSLALWRALPAVALDCALLLTLTDLTTDRRLLVRYGADDRVEAITPLEAPFGLVAPLPAQRVLAARRAGELELVWYDWRWGRGPGPAAR